MIHIQDTAEIYKKKNVLIWLTLAFKAGFINSAGFLATGKFVSHVTGFGTTTGIAIAHSDYFFGAELLIIPISFILGGVVTSFVLDRNYEHNETPPYYVVQTLISFLILLVIFLEEGNFVSSNVRFDEDNSYNLVEFLIIALLCFISGLKNSLVTWCTYGKIRVTHLTGLSTDLGLNLIRSLNYRQPGPRFREPKRVNLVRFLTFISFSAGALISAILFPLVGFKGMFVVFAISIVITFISIMDARSRAKMFSGKNQPQKV